MQTNAEDREVQARRICDLWRRLKEKPPRSGAVTDEKRRAELVEKLLYLCLPGVYEAVAQDHVSRVFCGLLIVCDTELKPKQIVGDFSTLREGARHALDTYPANRDKPVSVHVKTCVSEKLASWRDKSIARMRESRPEEVLSAVLEVPRYDAAVLLDHLSPEQCSDLKYALYPKLSESPVIHLQTDREPEDVHSWVYWYLHRSQLTRPEVKQDLGGIPKDAITVRRGAVRHKAGKVIFPLGPMYAHVWMALGGEINKYGRDIEQPQSVNRIAKSLNVSHGTVTAWLAQDLPGLNIRPDGEGGVFWDFTLATVARCVEIVVGGKRGPNKQA